MSDIDNVVIFKKQLGLNLEVEDRFVGLKMKENKIMAFNFIGPEKLKDEVENYFSKFKMQEPIKVDIGNTGDINCYFKGVSPVTEHTIDDIPVYNFTVYLQELEKTPIPGEEEACETCSGCGFH
ncbi:MAG: hypothetical protein Q4P18_05650 [Methanobrevibacter sp.]|uniref:hypothetical protein n=1 Tax=Methanobrevibacter sp. TaxID=66852 RepID=UPI0026DFF05A|nr:hypothetical protein [Methanobrevibacter sp.]MDO5848997.1 hypothetical protein [Methanobrevibacter sp.]